MQYRREIQNKTQRSMRKMAYVAVFLLISSVILTTFGAQVLKYSDIGTSKLEASEQSDSERLKELRRLIDNEIGVPYANDLSQCRLIGIGDLCPYRQKFLAYSTAKMSESKLKQLVGEYNQLEKQRNLELRGHWCPWGTARKPKLEFTDGICTAVDELKQKWEEWRRNK